MTLKKVIENEYCIGCGACSLVDNRIKFEKNNGIPIAVVPTRDIKNKLDEVCPFSDKAENENSLAEDIFSESTIVSEDIGRYEKLYAFRYEKSDVVNSSSGGGATWLISKLIESKSIDKVIHVKESSSKEKLYEYNVSSNIEEMNHGKKSKYYPVSLSEIIEIVDNDKHNNYVITAIPCFAKAIRLLQKSGYLENIKFVVGIFCGHYKSSYFVDYNSIQCGVKPESISKYDFRVKSPLYNANDYFISVSDYLGKEKLNRISEMAGNNWGHGLFKPKACEFCDDISGEVADVTFGDAWLPEYTSNWKGTNIVVVRNKFLVQFFLGNDGNFVEEISEEKIIESQEGNFRHRRGGVISRNSFVDGWKPKKRESLCIKYFDRERTNLYENRWNLSKKSMDIFSKRGVEYSDFKSMWLIYIEIIKYEYKQRTLSKFIVSELKRKIRKYRRLIFK